MKRLPLQTFVRYLFRSVAVFFLFLVMLIAFYREQAVLCSSLYVNTDQPQERMIEGYVLNSGVHTDLVLPVKTAAMDWSDTFPWEDFEPEDQYKFIAFGWGDRGFYMETPTWDDLKFGTALEAMLLPSESVMHVWYSSDLVLGDDDAKFTMTGEQYQRLCAFIQASFSEASPKPLPTTADYYHQNDRFYLGEGSYFFTYTCNVWTNRALQEAGVKTPLWSPFPEPICRALHE